MRRIPLRDQPRALLEATALVLAVVGVVMIYHPAERAPVGGADSGPGSSGEEADNVKILY